MARVPAVIGLEPDGQTAVQQEVMVIYISCPSCGAVVRYLSNCSKCSIALSPGLDQILPGNDPEERPGEVLPEKDEPCLNGETEIDVPEDLLDQDLLDDAFSGLRVIDRDEDEESFGRFALGRVDTGPQAESEVENEVSGDGSPEPAEESNRDRFFRELEPIEVEVGSGLADDGSDVFSQSLTPPDDYLELEQHLPVESIEAGVVGDVEADENTNREVTLSDEEAARIIAEAEAIRFAGTEPFVPAQLSDVVPAITGQTELSFEPEVPAIVVVPPVEIQPLPPKEEDIPLWLIVTTCLVTGGFWGYLMAYFIFH